LAGKLVGEKIKTAVLGLVFNDEACFFFVTATFILLL
jgi:hypothetical protein